MTCFHHILNFYRLESPPIVDIMSLFSTPMHYVISPLPKALDIAKLLITFTAVCSLLVAHESFIIVLNISVSRPSSTVLKAQLKMMKSDSEWIIGVHNDYVMITSVTTLSQSCLISLLNFT